MSRARWEVFASSTLLVSMATWDIPIEVVHGPVEHGEFRPVEMTDVRGAGILVCGVITLENDLVALAALGFFGEANELPVVVESLHGLAVDIAEALAVGVQQRGHAFPAHPGGDLGRGPEPNRDIE